MPVASVLEEMRSQPNILALVKDGNIDADAYPLSIQLLKEFRGSQEFSALGRREDVARLRADEGHRQRLLRGAARLDGRRPRGRATQRNADLAGRKVLAVGYGSGDAAEAIPMTVAPQLARRGRENRLRGGARSRTKTSRKQQYETLHDTGTAQGLRDPENGFVIQSIGSSANPKFSDEGIEYYRFVR